MGKTSAQANVKRVAKLAISSVYYLTSSLVRLGLKLMRRSASRDLVILYYHGVPLEYRANFARQMDLIRRWAQVVPAWYRGNLPEGRQNVAITFDDAYVSVAENALPELLARGFHATIFVPAGSLGHPPKWAIEDDSLDADETVMSAEQISALPSSLVTVGSHTKTHPHLSRIDVNAAQEEIDGSRVMLEALTAQEIRLLAFPYGDHDASTVELCKAAGYNFVFSVVPNSIDPTASCFVRGRVKADPFDWPLEFFLKFHGAYAWIPLFSSLKYRMRDWRRTRQVRRPSYGHQG